MSTLANAVFTNGDSDSENDPDFVPVDEEPSDDEGQVNKGEKVENEGDDEDEETKEKEKKARAMLWADFQASVSSSSKTPEASVPHPPARLVKIEKRHRFAGEDVVEVVEVPEDSQDAKKWPRWHPPSDTDKAIESSSTHAPTKPEPPTPSLSVIVSDSEAPRASLKNTTSTPAATSVVASSSSTPKPKPKPGPRKSKTMLPSLPSGKPKKLTTLEKSAMDWRAHLSEQDGGAVDELERNRRAGGGGYLEKVEFMDRVEGRREEIFEREKGSKRRKV